MDILDELSRMAGLASGPEEPSEQKIEQWQELFSYSRTEAIMKIKERAIDFDHQTTISDELWDEIKAEWISKGYDKEAYEHSLNSSVSISKQPAPSTMPTNSTSKKASYLVKLDGQISSPEEVQALLGLEKLPEVKHDLTDPTIRFCSVSATERGIIEASVFPKPTFISLGSGPSPKDLHSNSRYPTLGMDTTLPQHRATNSDHVKYEPQQDQYPVWYFFYGNLAIPEILSPRIGMSEENITSRLAASTIYGGKLASWRGKYKALLDGNPEDKVTGWSFLVPSREIEDWLRAYETSAYEVVRCEIERNDGSWVPGCVFRFCGDLSV